MNILFHCVQVPKIKVYYNSVYWFKATSRWALCTHQELRLLAKFVIGFVSCSLQVEDLTALVFDEADALAVANLLHEAVNPRQAKKYFYFDISASTLLNSLDRVLQVGLSEMLNTLIAIFKDECVIDTLFKLISNGSENEQIKASKLLWTLSRMKVFLPTFYNVEQLQIIIENAATNDEVSRLCQCVSYSTNDSGLKGTI